MAAPQPQPHPQHNLVKGAMLAAVAGFGAFLAWRAYRTPRSVRPGINAPFAADGDGSAFLERFEVESREIFAKSAKVIELLQIKPGSRVADLGAGTGLFLEQLAMAVTGSHLHHGGTDIDARGAVFLLDPYPKFVSHMRKRRTLLARSPTEMHASLARVFIGQNSYFSMDAPTGKDVIDADVETEPDRNEEDMERDAPATNIEDGSLDLVLTTDSYHHFEYPLSLVASVYRKLRVGGRFVVLDFERIEGESSAWVMGHVRAGREVVQKEIESVGFKFVENIAALVPLQENYLMVFEKQK